MENKGNLNTGRNNYEQFKLDGAPKKLNFLLLNDFMADALLENKKSSASFACHKAILASCSNYVYFCLLNGENTNGNGLITREGKLVIEIPEKINCKMSNAEDDLVIPILLKFVYNNQKFKKIKNDVNNTNVFNLLSLAHCFGVPKLTKHLTKMITSEILNEQNAIRVLNESLFYENDKLKGEAIQKIKKYFYNITKNLDEFSAFLELPLDIFLEIVNDDEISAETEKEICDLVFNYIKLRQNLKQEPTEEIKPIKEETNIQSNEEKEEKEEKTEPENIQEKIEDKKEEVNPEVNANSNGEQDAQKVDDNLEKKDEINTEQNIKPENVINKPDNQENNVIKSQNNSNYVDFWNKHILNLKEKLVKKPLSNEEVRKLIQSIRFSFLTHSELLSLSVENIMSNHKDLILEGLSLRLNSYEDSNHKENLIINTKPRNYKKEEVKKIPQNEVMQRQSTIKEKIQNSNQKEKSFNLNIEEDLVNMGLRNRESITFQPNLNLSAKLPTINQPNINFSLNNPRPPQDPKILLLTPTSKSYAKKKEIEFNYEYDLDENGVFFYLGTLGKSTSFNNPHEISQVKIFSSSLGQGKLSDLVGRNLVNLRTLNEPFSFFGVDLGSDRFLIPSCYSLRNRNSSSHVMLCWTLEASNDKINFETLDTRIFSASDEETNKTLEKERTLLKSPGCTSTWGIHPGVKEKFPNGFRYFVIRQIGPNSSGGFNMALSGLELYGKGLGRWTFV